MLYHIQKKFFCASAFEEPKLKYISLTTVYYVYEFIMKNIYIYIYIKIPMCIFQTDFHEAINDQIINRTNNENYHSS